MTLLSSVIHPPFPAHGNWISAWAGIVLVGGSASPLAGQGVDFNSYLDGPLASVTPGVTDKDFDGSDGWSDSCGASDGRVTAAAASGEYPGTGKHLRGFGTSDAYIGAKDFFVPFDLLSGGMVFDVLAASGAPVTAGLWFDADNDFRYDLAETQMVAGLVMDGGSLVFGIQGVGGGVVSSGITPSSGHWYRLAVIHGAPDGLGARTITLRVRDLTSGSELDFNPAVAGLQPWQVNVTASAFGIGADQAHGLAVRVTGADAAIDNLGPLTFAKDGDNLLPLNDPRCWVERFIPGSQDLARADPRMSSSFRNSPLGSSMEVLGFVTGGNQQTWRVGASAGATLSIGAGGLDVRGPSGGLQFGCDVQLTANQEWWVQPVAQFTPGVEFIAYSDYVAPTLDLGGFTATKTGPEDLWVRGGYDLSNGTLACAEGRVSLSSGGLSGDMKLAGTLTLRAETGGMISINNTGAGVTASPQIQLVDGDLNIGLDDFVLQPLTLAGPLSVMGASKLSFFSTNLTTTSGVRFSLSGPLTGSGTLHVIPSSPRPYTDRIRLEGDNSGFTGRVRLDAPEGNRTLQLRNANAGSASAVWEIAAGNTLEIYGASVQLGQIEGAGRITNAHPSNAATAVVGGGTFAGVLADGVRPLALTKVGPGTLVFAGTASYSGDTSLLAGQLRTTIRNGFSDASAIRLSTGAVLELDFQGSDTVSALFIDGVPQAAGIWGAPGSGAANTSPLLAGSGRLNVGTAIADPYQDWLDGFPSLTSPADTAPDADPDGDRIANQLEWILGGDPTQHDDPPLIAAENAAGLLLRFERAEAAVAQVNLAVEWTTDFTQWRLLEVGASSTGPDAYGATVTIDTAATPDRVTVFIPAANAPQGRIFARLKSGN
jgi:autotransporter-associated beta strand protein